MRSTSFPIELPYFFSSVFVTETGTLGFFLLSCFFLRFSLFFGLLSPMATFSPLMDWYDFQFYKLALQLIAEPFLTLT